jgi:hypothetical protein
VPKYEERAKERIRKGLRKYQKIISRARDEGFNEADTRVIVAEVLGELLGFDKFFEVSAEFEAHGKYADFCVKTDAQLRYFVEVKAIGTTLGDKHLAQVVSYSRQHALQWAVLTDGDVWECYYVEQAGPEVALAFSVGILDEQQPPEEKVERLFLISREGLWKGHLSRYWQRARALAPATLAEALLSEPTLAAIRTRLWKQTGQRLDMGDIADALIHSIIRGNVYESAKGHIALPKPTKGTAGEASKQELPAVCFAYVPDPGKPSTWKLRYRRPDGSADSRRLGSAVAAISPGGFRGKRVQIPPADLPAVKKRLRDAYAEAGRSQEEIPEGIRE